MSLKAVASLLFTLVLVYSLNRSWNFGAPVPALGKFLDPFHGFWRNAERRYPSNTSLEIPGLKGEVSVIYDSLLVPHIFATNDDDLYLVQGFVTARHRLWQMEFQTLGAAGRISEILGPLALDYDRGQRRLGMVFGAENNLKNVEADPLLAAVVSKYTEGVNAYIQGLDYEHFPIEYKLLDYAPEPWSNLKACLVQMNFSQTLNMDEKDLQFTNALKVFGKDKLDLLYPDYENAGTPIVDRAGQWNFSPVKLDSVPLAVPDEVIRLKPAVEKREGIGSNNWAVSGSKTATGAPIVCNDPHLSLGVPSIWFMVHLHSPSVNTMGVSTPGSPSVIIGFNDSIAWGVTNAQRDLADWYQIQFKDKTKNEYMSDGKWRPSKKVIEEIKVKNAKPFYDTVYYTHHGPVRYDENYHSDSEKRHFAFRWISHDAAEPIKAFYMLNRSRNFGDYSEALNHHFSPAQNFVFGSVSGDIGIRVQGRFPVRRPYEGKFVLDGTKTSTEWKAFIPFDQNAVIKNPAQGFVLSANQYPVDNTYPYYVQSGVYYEAYRNRRISDVLSHLSSITPRDMMKLQDDNLNLQAKESLPFMLSQLDSTHLTDPDRITFQTLRAWDFFNSEKSEAAIYYEEWWNEFSLLLWDEMTQASVLMSMPSDFTTIKLMKTNQLNDFTDIQTTPKKETLKEVIQSSFAKATRAVEEWKSKNKNKTADWANYKDTYVQHLLRIEPFGFHARNGGNNGIVNASSHRNGPSWRMIVSLEKSGVKAWGVYPGGQSGNPGSAFYGNMMGAWEKAQPTQLKFVQSPQQLAQTTLCTAVLKPSSK